MADTHYFVFHSIPVAPLAAFGFVGLSAHCPCRCSHWRIYWAGRSASEHCDLAEVTHVPGRGREEGWRKSRGRGREGEREGDGER